MFYSVCIIDKPSTIHQGTCTAKAGIISLGAEISTCVLHFWVPRGGGFWCKSGLVVSFCYSTLTHWGHRIIGFALPDTCTPTYLEAHLSVSPPHQPCTVGWGHKSQHHKNVCKSCPEPTSEKNYHLRLNISEHKFFSTLIFIQKHSFLGYLGGLTTLTSSSMLALPRGP